MAYDPPKTTFPVPLRHLLSSRDCTRKKIKVLLVEIMFYGLNIVALQMFSTLLYKSGVTSSISHIKLNNNRMCTFNQI